MLSDENMHHDCKCELANAKEVCLHSFKLNVGVNVHFFHPYTAELVTSEMESKCGWLAIDSYLTNGCH